MTAQQLFAAKFNDITTVIEFNKSWYNGTGYLDHAVTQVKLAVGARAKSVTPNDRRIILIGTTVGAVVIFERFSPDAEGKRSNVIVSNMHRSLRLFDSGALDASLIDHLVGVDHINIGYMVGDIARALGVKQPAAA